ncbi:hypothetical protein FOZ63_017223, partial [Perkinsus olseni]
ARLDCAEFPSTSDSDKERVGHLKGLTLTRLLTSKSIWRQDKSPNNFVLRKAASAIGKFVNSHGGWVIQGWVKGGILQEESAGDGDINMYKEVEKIHVVRVFPEEEEKLREKLEELKMKREQSEPLGWSGGKANRIPREDLEDERRGENDSSTSTAEQLGDRRTNTRVEESAGSSPEDNSTSEEEPFVDYDSDTLARDDSV